MGYLLTAKRLLKKHKSIHYQLLNTLGYGSQGAIGDLSAKSPTPSISGTQYEINETNEITTPVLTSPVRRRHKRTAAELIASGYPPAPAGANYGQCHLCGKRLEGKRRLCNDRPYTLNRCRLCGHGLSVLTSDALCGRCVGAASG